MFLEQIIEHSQIKKKKNLNKQQIEEEKDRRVDALPRFRDDDKIDTDEEYLDIVWAVFDACDRVAAQHDAVDALQFFMALKKDPAVAKLSSTIAREPDGKSRIATETFAEVFYRMEKTHADRAIDWAAVLEYFTKRGRPLTADELEQRRLEDQAADDEYDQQREAEAAEEQQFFASLRDDQLQSSFRSRDIDDGRDDIEDMEFAGTVRDEFRTSAKAPDFASTVGSKKKVTFQDSLNDRQSTLGSRPRTAKSRFDDVLQRESLAGADYADHKRTKQAQSGERITVPRPFSFDTRDKVRPKSIRERKVDEMIELKKLEEDRLLGFRFRAKQPPKKVVMPLLQRIVTQNEQRRKEVKENSMKLLKAMERPFSFYERDKLKQQQKRKAAVKH